MVFLISLPLHLHPSLFSLPFPSTASFAYGLQPLLLGNEMQRSFSGSRSDFALERLAVSMPDPHREGWSAEIDASLVLGDGRACLSESHADCMSGPFGSLMALGYGRVLVGRPTNHRIIFSSMSSVQVLALGEERSSRVCTVALSVWISIALNAPAAPRYDSR